MWLLHAVNYIEWGPANPADARSSTHINACMSTGFWFIQPTAPAKALLAAFKDLQLNWRNWQVDQQLWNEVQPDLPILMSILDAFT